MLRAGEGIGMDHTASRKRIRTVVLRLIENNIKERRERVDMDQLRDRIRKEIVENLSGPMSSEEIDRRLEAVWERATRSVEPGLVQPSPRYVTAADRHRETRRQIRRSKKRGQ